MHFWCTSGGWWVLAMKFWHMSTLIQTFEQFCSQDHDHKMGCLDYERCLAETSFYSASCTEERVMSRWSHMVHVKFQTNQCIHWYKTAKTARICNQTLFLLNSGCEMHCLFQQRISLSLLLWWFAAGPPVAGPIGSSRPPDLTGTVRLTWESC